MIVEVFSDVACPWCYIGHRRLARALERFAAGGAVRVVWRSYELQPRLPDEVDASGEAFMAESRHRPLFEVHEAMQRVAHVAEAEGLAMDFARLHVFNTRRAHELLHFAQEHGTQPALVERLFRGTFTEGLALGDPAVLLAAAAEAGLDPLQAGSALEDGRFTHVVREDEEQAVALGVASIPYFLIDGHLAVTGAQPVAVLLRALEKAWAARDIEGTSETAAPG